MGLGIVYNVGMATVGLGIATMGLGIATMREWLQ